MKGSEKLEKGVYGRTVRRQRIPTPESGDLHHKLHRLGVDLGLGGAAIKFKVRHDYLRRRHCGYVWSKTVLTKRWAVESRGLRRPKPREENGKEATGGMEVRGGTARIIKWSVYADCRRARAHRRISLIGIWVKFTGVRKKA